MRLDEAFVAFGQALLLPTFLVTLIMKIRLARNAGRNIKWWQWTSHVEIKIMQDGLPVPLQKKFAVLNFVSNSAFVGILVLVVYGDFKFR